MIFVDSRRKKLKTLDKLYPKAKIIDVTSKGEEPFIKLSPFFPHGNIPVPFSNNAFSYSVEGIWQGLKVFENANIDITKFEIQNMKEIKRTVRKFGKTLGHRKGVNGSELLGYLAARKLIYLPSYAWVLQNKTIQEINHLIEIALKQDLVLLDYVTNSDIENTSKPLSHAALIKKYIDKKYPELTTKRFNEPIKTTNKKKQNQLDKRKKNRGEQQLKIDL